jgi:hypothetical protein
MSVNSSPLERGLPGSRRVDHHADGLDDDWGVADNCAPHSVVALIVDNPQRWPAKDGSQQYGPQSAPYTVAYVVDGQLIRPSRAL